MMKLRFAPSPTGYIHIGNARTLLVNWLYAQKHGAEFILRFDDTDRERSRDEYAQQIIQDMAWLNLDYKEVVKQSDRYDLYRHAAEGLKESGRLYPCFETKEELDFKRKRQLSQGKPPLYDRAALKLTPEEIDHFMKEGRTPHWRFKLADELIEWVDLCHGPISFQGANLSDPIVIRENGDPIFTFSGAFDDMDLGITHIIRGNDHLANTAIQIQMISALGGNPKSITFGHTPLITGAQGEGLSKREGSLSIKDLKEEGFEALAIENYLAHMGISEEFHLSLTLEKLVQDFEITKLGKSSPKFLYEDLARTNMRLLHQRSFEDVQGEIQELGLHNITADIWYAVRENLNFIQDIKHISHICFEDITPVIMDAKFCQLAADKLPVEPWTEETWSAWTNALKEETGRKGKELFMPLRQALTAQEHGPEMKKLLPIIGYERAKKRLLYHDA